MTLPILGDRRRSARRYPRGKTLPKHTIQPGFNSLSPQKPMCLEAKVVEMRALAIVLSIGGGKGIGIGPLNGNPLLPKALLGLTNPIIQRVFGIVVANFGHKPWHVPTSLFTTGKDHVLEHTSIFRRRYLMLSRLVRI